MSIFTYPLWQNGIEILRQVQHDTTPCVTVTPLEYSCVIDTIRVVFCDCDTIRVLPLTVFFLHYFLTAKCVDILRNRLGRLSDWTISRADSCGSTRRRKDHGGVRCRQEEEEETAATVWWVTCPEWSACTTATTITVSSIIGGEKR